MADQAGGRQIREPIAEGVFYPAEPAELEQEIRTRLQNSTIIADSGRALIVPYAGYTYCGDCLAAGYKSCAARKIERVILLGPCHRCPEPGVYAPESTGFRVPTGVIEVDVQAIARAEAVGAVVDDIPHLDEHSVEVQLPFLHYLFPHAKIVPLLVQSVSILEATKVSDVLRSIADPMSESDLLVVAANVSGAVDRRDARHEAGAIIDAVLEGGYPRLEAHSESLSAAGLCCIAGALRYIGDSDGWEVVDRGDSYSVDGDPSNSVEYAALVLGANQGGANE